MPASSRYDQMHDLVLRRLIARHGELMDTLALSNLLKFGNTRSFRRAAVQGHLPFRVFHIDGRRGWFARTGDVAAWLAKIQSQHH